MSEHETDKQIADSLFSARKLCGAKYNDPGIYLGFLGVHLLDTISTAPDPAKQLEHFVAFCKSEMETEAFKQRWRNAQAAMAVAK